MEVKPGYKQTEVGVIPEEWEFSRIGTLCAAVLDCHHSTPVWTASGSVVIRNQNIRDGKLDLSQPSYTNEIHFAERTRRAVPSFGDLVITREAPMGLVCMIPKGLKCCLGQRMVLLRPNHDAAETEYLLYALLSEAVQRSILVAGGTGSTVSNLRIPVLKGLEISAPPLPEQRAIATALSDVDALLGGLDRLIAKKRDLKQAAMQQLLTGQTRLPGFSGAWEVKRLGEQIIRLRKTNRPSAAGRSEGKYPFFTNSTKPCDKYLDEFDFDTEAIIANTGGEAFFNYFKGPFAAMADCLVLESRVVTRFLYFLLKTMEQRINDTGFTGSGIKHLDKRYFSDIELRLPPTATEQTAIAAVLSDMDAELAALEQRRDKTRDLKQAMMQELLTGRTRLV